METGYAMAETEAKVATSPVKKQKKAGFFKRWLLKSVKEAVQEEREPEVVDQVELSTEE